MCIRDSTETDPERDRRFITVRQENGEVIYGSHPLYYFGDLETEYEKRNGEDRKSTRLNSSHSGESRMPSSA